MWKIAKESEQNRKEVWKRIGRIWHNSTYEKKNLHNFADNENKNNFHFFWCTKLEAKKSGKVVEINNSKSEMYGELYFKLSSYPGVSRIFIRRRAGGSRQKVQNRFYVLSGKIYRGGSNPSICLYIFKNTAAHFIQQKQRLKQVGVIFYRDRNCSGFFFFIL